MHQTCKGGNQWFLCMKAHIGVSQGSGLMHSVATPSANVHDVTMATELVAWRGESGNLPCGLPFRVGQYVVYRTSFCPNRLPDHCCPLVGALGPLMRTTAAWISLKFFVPV